MSFYWFYIWTCLKHSGHLSTGKKNMWECRKDKSGTRCNSKWTNSISNLPNKLRSLSKNRENNYKKAKYSELKESIDTETEKELLKRHIGSNFQLNLFQGTISLSPQSVLLGMHSPALPWLFPMGIPSSANMGIHPGSTLAHFQPCGRGSTHQGLSRCAGEVGTAQTSLCGCLQTEPAGKASTPPWSGHTSCRHLGVSLQNISGAALPSKQPTGCKQCPQLMESVPTTCPDGGITHPWSLPAERANLQKKKNSMSVRLRSIKTKI